MKQRYHLCSIKVKSSVERELGDIELEGEMDLLLNLNEAGQELCALKDGQLKLGVPPAAKRKRKRYGPALVGNKSTIWD